MNPFDYQREVFSNKYCKTACYLEYKLMFAYNKKADLVKESEIHAMELRVLVP